MTTGPNSHEWLVAQLRLTLFPADPRDLSGEVGWWSEFAETEPETRTTSKKLLGFQEEGDFSDGRLALSVQLDRIDWILSPALPVELEMSGPGFPTLGQYPMKAEPFLAGARRWLKKAPTKKRLAFGAVLLQSVADKIAGYRALQEYLHSVQIDPIGMRDFLYQINRRRNSAVLEGLEVNRLAKWSVVVRRLVPMSASGGEMPYTLGSAARLELDISSAAEYSQAIPEHRVVGLFDEIVGMASEIAEEGDVP